VVARRRSIPSFNETRKKPHTYGQKGPRTVEIDVVQAAPPDPNPGQRDKGANNEFVPARQHDRCLNNEHQR